MIDYLYDGSFEGLLTCIFEHYYSEKAAGIYPETEYQAALTQDCRCVFTDGEKAERVWRAVREKISPTALRQVYQAYLSSVPGKERIILEYLIFGFKKGHQTGSLRGAPEVCALQKAAHKVFVEVDRMRGLLRFSVLDAGDGKELLFAKISPDHDILEFLGDHFADRFRYDPFMIYDERRQKALFGADRKWEISPLDPAALPEAADSEDYFRNLWRLYFDTIAIKERVNPKCQKNFMPVRYWKNLPEIRAKFD